jgi:hypothetical protein
MKVLKLENSPVKVARKLLLGTLLGDSRLALTRPKNLMANATRAYLRMVHANSQFEYLMWKGKKLVPLVGKFNIFERPTKFGGRKTGGFYCRLISLSSKYLKHIWDDFYFVRGGNLKKEVHSNVLNRLTPISLAVLYGDDGNLHPQGSVRIATNGFSFDEVNLICKILKNRFGIQFHPRLHHQSNSYIIMADVENSKLFLELVRPYLWEIQCLRYKLDSSFKKDPDCSARHPKVNFWDEEVLRTPQVTGGKG